MEEKFRWFRCKKCNKPLFRITDKSIIVNEMFCRYCKTSFQIEIYNGKISKVEEIKQD